VVRVTDCYGRILGFLDRYTCFFYKKSVLKCIRFQVRLAVTTLYNPVEAHGEIFTDVSEERTASCHPEDGESLLLPNVGGLCSTGPLIPEHGTLKI
jgi:hypothetical protein